MSFINNSIGHNTTGIIAKFPVNTGILHRTINIISFIINPINPYSLLLAVKYVAIKLATILKVLTKTLFVLKFFNK